MADITNLISDSRAALLERNLEPSTLYLGRDQYISLRKAIKFYELSPRGFTAKNEVYMGLEVLLVNKDDHFRVCAKENRP